MEQGFVSQCDNDGQVARGASREVPQERACRARVDDVGNQHDQRALSLALGEGAEGRSVVRLDERGL